ncbi:MAG: hypothetical protein IJN40_07065 [Clostridia bacterium]|nr:hypothetical protein [Clostridia bacterium]
MLCYKCNRAIPDNALVCPNCGAEMSVYARRSFESGADANPFTSLTPMVWYKVLIYFSLYASAITGVINGISYLTGYIYAIQSAGKIDAYMIYMEYGKGLMITDIVYGIISVVYSLFALVVRSKLAGFKKNAPLYLYIWYGIGAVISFGYAVSIGVFGNVPNSYGLMQFPQLIGEAVFIWINYIYFSKRKHFFVN